MSAMQQPTPNHQSETFGSGQTQFFECEALSADHPEIQARERPRQQRLQLSNYGIDQHRHRFAVWAAARAAQRGFAADVDTLRRALEASGVVEFLDRTNLSDIDEARFDAHHLRWCRSIVDFLNNVRVPNVSFGRAAKLIAIYLKAVVVLGPGSETLFARVAHPPIDSILLRNLAASCVGSEHRREWDQTRWTQLNEGQYYKLIEQLRQALGTQEPFWRLECFWTVTNDAEV
jgi:hypothetical protein